MRLIPILAAFAAALFAVPAAAQDPIAQSVEMLGNYDNDGAKEVLDTACKGGNSEACWRLALVMSEDYQDEAMAETDKQFLANCAKGEVRSCYMIQRRVSYDADDKSKARGLTALRKACDGGLGFACSDLASQLESVSNEGAGLNDAQKKEVAGLYEKGCAQGFRSACESASNYFGNDYENPLFDRSKAIALRLKACEMGSEDGCRWIPDLERGAIADGESPTVEQHRRWQGFRKRACELGGSSSCESWLNEQVKVP